MHGKGTLYSKNNKIRYEGDVAYGYYEGNGILFFENGQKYVGEFSNNFANGNGILFDDNDNIIHEGKFINEKYKEKE